MNDHFKFLPFVFQVFYLHFSDVVVMILVDGMTDIPQTVEDG